MNQTRPNDTATPIACAIDESCGPDNECGCNATPSADHRKGAKAALLGVLCVTPARRATSPILTFRVVINRKCPLFGERFVG